MLHEEGTKRRSKGTGLCKIEKTWNCSLPSHSISSASSSTEQDLGSDFWGEPLLRQCSQYHIMEFVVL